MSVSGPEHYNYDNVLNYHMCDVIIKKWYFVDVRFPNNIDVIPMVNKFAQSCHFQAHVCFSITVFAFV